VQAVAVEGSHSLHTSHLFFRTPRPPHLYLLGCLLTYLRSQNKNIPLKLVHVTLDKREIIRHPNNMDTVEQPLARQQRTVRALAKQLGLRIISLNQFFLQRMQHEMLTPSQAAVLTLLMDNRSWRVSDLACAEGVRPPSMTELVSRMQRQGWLRKSDTMHDRRGVEVTITEEGRAIIQEFMRRQVDIIAQRLALLPDEEKTAIERALPAIDHLLNG
jgi:DNA-binding MarR family transcriptional regulator